MQRDPALRQWMCSFPPVGWSHFVSCMGQIWVFGSLVGCVLLSLLGVGEMVVAWIRELVCSAGLWMGRCLGLLARGEGFVPAAAARAIPRDKAQLGQRQEDTLFECHAFKFFFFNISLLFNCCFSSFFFSFWDGQKIKSYPFSALSKERNYRVIIQLKLEYTCPAKVKAGSGDLF